MKKRRKIIENIVNDKVNTINKTLYQWRSLYFEVIPYKKILRTKSLKASHFTKVQNGKTIYGVREVSTKLLKKRYPKYYLTILSN